MRFLLFFFLCAVPSVGFSFNNLSCHYIQKKFEPFLRISHSLHPSSRELQRRMVERTLFFIDPKKLYFTQSDVNFIEGLFENQSLCISFWSTRNIFLYKMEKSIAFAKTYLRDKAFKIDPNAEISFDYDVRVRTQDEEARLQALSVFFQKDVQTFQSLGYSLSESIENTIKSYDRDFHAWKMQSQDNILAMYLRSYMASLDPHSSYLSIKELNGFEQQLTLSVESIGLSLKKEGGVFVVDALTSDGAAKESGKIFTGDIILSVGRGKDLYKWVDLLDENLSDIRSLIKGKAGTTVSFKILRKAADGSEKTIKVSIVRGNKKLRDQSAKLVVVDKKISGTSVKVGIIELPVFYYGKGPLAPKASEDVLNLIRESKHKGVQSLVLDLSTNSGGSLEGAVQVAGLFMSSPVIVGASKNHIDTHIEKFQDKDPRTHYDGPLVVLVSRRSASASEIVAGALQDYGRAVIVGGEQTYGKGTIQILHPSVAENGNSLGAFKITQGMFYVPSGYSTQYRGVRPDIKIPDYYEMAFTGKHEMGESFQKYSLPASKRDSFLSDLEDGLGTWGVDSSLIESLQEKSSERIQGNQSFQHLEEKSEEVKKAIGKNVWLLSELKAPRFKDADHLGQQEALYEERPEVQEAAAVAADLFIALGRKSGKASRSFFR